MHALHQESLIFHRSLAFSGAKYPWLFPPLLGFSQEFPSSENPWVFRGVSLFWCNISYIFPSFWTHCIMVFAGCSFFWCNISNVFPHFWPYCTTNPWVFTGFLFSDATFPRFSTFLGPTLLRPKYWSHVKFPTCAYKHTSCTSRICKNLQIFWPKTILVCKAIFTYSKISLPDFICLRLGLSQMGV